MRRRGFASFTAIVMLALVASAITLGTGWVATQWRRSQARADETQRRQYLLAGEVYAAALLAEGGDEATAPLPGGGTLRVERVDDLRVRVTAEHEGKRRMQVLIYEREGEALVLRGAELSGEVAVSR